MPLTMKHTEWMKRTYSRIKRRSTALKALDKAILSRNVEDAKSALVSWIDGQFAKKKDWRKSVRNWDGAVKELHEQLGILGAHVHKQNVSRDYKNVINEFEDVLAKKEIQRLQLAAKADMFRGKKVQIKGSTFGISRDKRTGDLNKVKTVGGVTYKGGVMAKNAKALVDTLAVIMTNVEPANQSEIYKLVFGAAGANASQFAAQAAPILGLAYSGGAVAYDWYSIAQANQNKLKMTAIGDLNVIREGDPSKALKAINKILDREISTRKNSRAIHGTAFAAKGVSFFADAGGASGPLIGAVEAVAGMMNDAYELAKDFIELQKANKLIKAEKFDLKLFETCPILGCYYLVVQDQSTVMDFNFENMGRENWMQEARLLALDIKPVIKKAQDLIHASRIEIKGMELSKGVYKSTTKQKLGLWVKSI